MPRYAGADWVGPTPNQDVGQMGEVHGLVLHVSMGLMPGLESWLKNPHSDASAHFINPKQGKLHQLVDTADKAWAQKEGNRNWVSVENESFGEPLNENQLNNLVGLVRWMNMTYSMPLRLADTPTGDGIGWHGMGGQAWGNHANCPGAPIRAQRQMILDRVNTSPPQKEGIMGALTVEFTPSGNGYWIFMTDGAVFAYGDAEYYGGMNSQPLKAPIVKVHISSTGKGYALLGGDGGFFAFGDIPFLGSPVK